MVYLLLCVSSVSEQMSLFVCVCLINSRPLKGISLFKRESEKCFSLTYVLALPRRGLLSEDLYKQLTAAFFMSLKYPSQRTHTHMHYLLVLWPFPSLNRPGVVSNGCLLFSCFLVSLVPVIFGSAQFSNYSCDGRSSWRLFSLSFLSLFPVAHFCPASGRAQKKVL